MNGEKLLLGAVCALLLAAFPAIAVEPDSPEWAMNPSKGFVSKSMRVGPLFQIQIDGRSLVASPVTRNQDQSPSDGIPLPGEDKEPLNLTATFDGKPVSMVRKMTLDARRNAIFVVDIFTNRDASERNIRVDYTTSLANGGSVRFNGVIGSNGESRENGNGVPDTAVGAIVLAESKDSQAVPLFMWGQREALWAPTITDVGSTLRLRYEGSVPAGGRVALIHWVAVAGVDPKVKFERTFDLFWKNDHLIDTPLAADVIPLVMNFKPEAFTKAATAVGDKTMGQLLALDQTCEKLGLKRGDTDILWLGKAEQLAGTLSADSVSLEHDGATQTIPLDNIAAIQGGGGRGRLHRLWLRDGSIQNGRVTIQKATLQSKAGTVSLNADSLEFLLLRGKPEDGSPPAEGVSLVQLGDGQRLWLGAAPFSALDVITAFGRVKVPAASVVSIARKAEPPFPQQVLMKDGTRLVGVLAEPVWQCSLASGGKLPIPSATIQRWAGRDAVDADDAAAASPPSHVLLRDGSILAGLPTESVLQLRTSSGELEVNVGELASAKFEYGSVSVTLQSGTTMQGQFSQESLSVKILDQTLMISTTQMSEMVRASDTTPEK